MPRDDDRDVRRPLSDRDADAVLRGHAVAGEEGLTSFVSDLQSLADDAAPAPSAALAAMFDGGLVPDLTASPTLPPAPRRRWWLVPIPLTVVLVGATMGAAGANALPGPAQRVVSDTVASISPIHLPKPKVHPAPKAKPSPTPAVAPGHNPVVVHPTERPHRVTPKPVNPKHSDDHGHGDGGSNSGRGPQASPTPQRDNHVGSGSGSSDREGHGAKSSDEG
jgi:hypothetical protein